MERFIDKLAIILICLPALMQSDGAAAPVTAFLAAVTVSALAQVFPRTRMTWVLLGLSAGLCGLLPEMFCMMPLLLYDALWEKNGGLSSSG